TRAVDVVRAQAYDLAGTQTGGISGRERHTIPAALHRLEKSGDLLRAQDHRKRFGPARIGDALGKVLASQRDAKEEAQRGDDLVECRPGNPPRHQVDLVGTNILEAETIRGSPKILAKLLDVVDINFPSRRRQIADRHVLDHATAQRADTFSPHSEGSCLFVVDSQTQPDRQAASLYKPSATLSTGITIAISGHYRASGSVQSPMRCQSGDLATSRVSHQGPYLDFVVDPGGFACEPADPWQSTQ